MLTGIGHRAVLVLGLLLIAVVTACGGGSSETETETEIEVKEEAKIQAVMEDIPHPIPTVSHVPSVTHIPISPTPATEEKEDGTCILTGGEVVQESWSGKDTGANYCNQCRCMNAGLACTRMACPPKLLATPTTVTPTPIATDMPTPTQTQETSEFPFKLKISEIATDIPSYDRKDWRHWIDEDSDCQNTRHEVLLEESLKEVTFKSNKQCQVATGEWLDPYTGTVVTDATNLDVDHMVPLKNVHDSGGWTWDKEKKSVYANEMGYADHLIAVTASVNRKKGAKGPENWRPGNRDYWCDYAIDWVAIKVVWELSATKVEWAALQEMLKTCKTSPSITPTFSKSEGLSRSANGVG